MEAVGAILFFALIAIGVRLALGSFDRQRIERYIRERGGRVVSITWAPFGRGWFGEKSDRIYEIVYYDDSGDQHMATCKTSAWTGVYFTEDRTAHRRAAWEDRIAEGDARGEPLIRAIDPGGLDEASSDEELRRLREENRELRERIARLEDRGT